MPIDAGTPGRMILETQKLMVACGMPPLPGYFLRGLTQRNLTIVLVDRMDQIVACAVAIDERGAGAEYAGWYFPSSICVVDGWMGKRLGRWLNARAIQLARDVGAAKVVHEVFRRRMSFLNG